MIKIILTNGKELLINLITYKNRTNEDCFYVRYSIKQIGCVFDDIKDLIKPENRNEVVLINSKSTL